jgi:hypothetical protein
MTLPIDTPTPFRDMHANATPMRRPRRYPIVMPVFLCSASATALVLLYFAGSWVFNAVCVMCGGDM